MTLPKGVTASSATFTNQIREMNLSGELAPGERLTETALAERMGVSRTPIRNYLPGLAAEGMLEIVGRPGFAGKVFSEVDSLDALELRALLEGAAARRVARDGASPDVLAALDQCLKKGDELLSKGHLGREDERGYGEMNQRFHAVFVEACGCSVLSMMIDRLNMVLLVAPSVIIFDQIGLRRAFELPFRAHGHHHAIVDAICSRGGERAELPFREHAHRQRISMFARRQSLRIAEEEPKPRPHAVASRVGAGAQRRATWAGRAMSERPIRPPSPSSTAVGPEARTRRRRFAPITSRSH